MRRLGLILAIVALLVLAWLARRERPEPNQGDGREGGSTTTGVEDLLDARLAADVRLAVYLGGCVRNEPFSEDTTDTVRVLLGKLESGAPDPLHRAKTELAEMGQAALPDLQRFVDERFEDAALVHTLQNAFEVVMAMREPWGRSLLRQGLGHPAELVRRAAIRGLGRHASPYEYDALYALLASSHPDVRAEIVTALYRADPKRFEEDLVSWLVANEFDDVWSAATPLLSMCVSAATAERLAPLWRDLGLDSRLFAASCAARHGNDDALAYLRAQLDSDNPLARSMASRSLAAAGFTADVADLIEHSDPALRLFAVQAIDTAGDFDDDVVLLSKALGDEVSQVRDLALGALLARGDVAAEDQALEMLRGDREQLNTALTALGRGMGSDPELARRALAILVEEYAARQHRGAGELALLEQGIGRVPLPAAVDFLCDLGASCALGARGARAQMRDHRWFALKAGNAARGNVVARAVLLQRWQAEDDPQRRMDFIEAIAFDHQQDVVREFLLDALRRDDLHPYEMLHLAMTLARAGPAATVAPALKRATLEIDHARVRPALHCLLWDWY